MFVAVLAVMLLIAVGCEAGPPSPPAGDGSAPTYEGPPKRLPGGGYDILRGRAQPGEPFETTTLVVSRLEVRNTTDVPLVPVCVLLFGSQTALIDVEDEALQPGERGHLQGPARFLRPLDDYESGDAGCYTSLPADLAREIERQEAALRPGLAVTVPNLIGRTLDAALPSFRRGLDIEVTTESTPCTTRRLMELSRSVVGEGGATGCARPVVASQQPAAESTARVGDVIRIRVVSNSH